MLRGGRKVGSRKVGSREVESREVGAESRGRDRVPVGNQAPTAVESRPWLLILIFIAILISRDIYQNQ